MRRHKPNSVGYTLLYATRRLENITLFDGSKTRNSDMSYEYSYKINENTFATLKNILKSCFDLQYRNLACLNISESSILSLLNNNPN